MDTKTRPIYSVYKKPTLDLKTHIDWKWEDGKIYSMQMGSKKTESWSMFFHPLTYSLYASWGLKCVSYKQHIYGSCFCIHSASLCLLLGTFNPFTCKVIIDIYVPIAIFLIVWGWFCSSFFFPCISWLYKPL